MSSTSDPTCRLLKKQKSNQSESEDSLSKVQDSDEHKKVIDITSEPKYNASERVPNIPMRMTTRLACKPKSTPVSRLTLITRLNPPK